jgi:uncharacterized coiled-coil protein SlyX
MADERPLLPEETVEFHLRDLIAGQAVKIAQLRAHVVMLTNALKKKRDEDKETTKS